MNADAPQTVTLVVPSDARFHRSVRLAVGGIATLVGFDIEAIEDLRIGVDELCGALGEAGNGDELSFEVVASIGSGIRIEGTTARGAGDNDATRFSFSRQILSVVADDHGLEVDEPTVRCWLARSLGDREPAADAS
jgi:hypothetical protein